MDGHCNISSQIVDPRRQEYRDLNPCLTYLIGRWLVVLLTGLRISPNVGSHVGIIGMGANPLLHGTIEHL